MAQITGTSGNDSLVGTAGDDTLDGLGGNDTLLGNGGNDRLIGGSGSDSLNGGLGNDTYVVGSGDLLSDSGGTDTVESSISWTLSAAFENLTFTGTGTTSGTGNESANVITGNSGNNWMRGKGGNDTLFGGAGNDTFNMSLGAGSVYGSDSMDGGTGVDTLDFGATAVSAVVIDLGAGTASGGGSGGAGSVTLANIENANGSAFDDRMTGSAAANRLFGYNGNDIIDGREGNDRLEGGAGNDQYVFSATPGTANADTVVGFVSGTDKIVLMNLALGADGSFAAGDERFAAGSGFTSGQDASDRVVYNTTTGQLFYDEDGNGSGAALLVATLSGAPTLVATDIVAEDSSSSGGQVINGTSGDDSLTGTPGNETINGLGGNDTIDGAGGSDSLNGGAGNDSIVGGVFDPGTVEGGDVLVGGDGEDTLNGINHAMFRADVNVDTLDGGFNNDVYWVDNAGDVLTDAGGFEVVHAVNTDWTLGAGFEDLVLHTDEFEFGAGIGNGLANHMSITWQGRLEGMGGNDTLVGGTGGFSDELFGGDGNDLIQGNVASLADGGAGDDTLSGAFNMTGGAGADDFDLDFFDFITDFSSRIDTLIADGNEFENVGPSGRFASGDGRFHAAAGATLAHDSDDRFIYDTASGELHYDPDGTGPTSGFFVGTLQGAPTLVANDIEVVNGSGGGSAINGTEGNDTLTGTIGNDTIDGRGGDDSIDGQDGADSLIGGAGNDTLEAGLDGSLSDSAIDTLDGGLGDDVYSVSAIDDGNSDVILADPGGVDLVVAHTSWTLGAGLENLDLHDFLGTAIDGTGNELNNTIRSGSEGGTLRGMGGNDVLIARQVQNSTALFGGDGNDTLQGNGNGERLGEAGNDVLIADAFSTVLTGGEGTDDFVFQDTGSEHRITDFASDIDEISLDATDMPELGTSGEFASGDPRFYAAPGATSGHDADDRVIYNTTTNELFFDPDGSNSGAAQRIVTLQAGAPLVATDITVINGTSSPPPPPSGGETVNGTTGNDSLVGTAGDDTINALYGEDLLQGLGGNDSMDGAAGHDTLQGGDGNDWLHGGWWSDTLTGGTGADSFVYTEYGTNHDDRITDFAAGTDELVFENGNFSAIGAAGAWAAGDARFAAGAGFTSGRDASDRLIYNTTTGTLYYDADGSGTGAAQIVATLQGTPAIAATDITVI